MTVEKKPESTKNYVHTVNKNGIEEIYLRIDIQPDSWKAPKFVKNHAYDEMRPYKDAVKLLIKKIYEGTLIYVPVEIDFKFYFKPVVKKRNVNKKIYLYHENCVPCIGKKDCTNMQKLFEDCLQGIVLYNDRQVTKISSEKLWAESEFVECRIRQSIKGDFQTLFEEKTGTTGLKKIWFSVEHVNTRRAIKVVPEQTKIT